MIKLSSSSFENNFYAQRLNEPSTADFFLNSFLSSVLFKHKVSLSETSSIKSASGNGWMEDEEKELRQRNWKGFIVH